MSKHNFDIFDSHWDSVFYAAQNRVPLKLSGTDNTIMAKHVRGEKPSRKCPLSYVIKTTGKSETKGKFKGKCKITISYKQKNWFAFTASVDHEAFTTYIENTKKIARQTAPYSYYGLPGSATSEQIEEFYVD